MDMVVISHARSLSLASMIKLTIMIVLLVKQHDCFPPPIKADLNHALALLRLEISTLIGFARVLSVYSIAHIFQSGPFPECF